MANSTLVQAHNNILTNEQLTSVQTKLNTIKTGLLDVREAIKEVDGTLAEGTIDTIGDDIRTLNRRNYVYRWVNNNGTYSLERDINDTDNIANSKYLNNTNILAVALPKNIKILNTECFKSTTNLKYINLNAVESIDNAAFEKSGITIDISSFKGSTVGTYAFWKSSITGILADPNLSSINVYAFAETNIIEIQDLGTITSISNVGFSHCESLTFVKIPSTVTSIGNSAFEGCSKLETVVVLAVSPPTLSNAYVFNLCPALTTIYVPYSSDHSVLNAYKGATNWSTHASKIVELNEDGSIPS